VVAAQITVLPIVIGFVVAMAAFGAYLPWMIEDSRRSIRPPLRSPVTPPVVPPLEVPETFGEPPLVVGPLVPPPQPVPVPAARMPAWRAVVVGASFFVLSMWSTWSARSRRFTRH
jgi:hypothetical protein